METLSGIYTITNDIDGKIYVGSSTRNVHERMASHKCNLKKNKHANIHLQRVWNRLGEDCFSFEVLEFCESHFCIGLEQYWINMLNVCNDNHGYNFLYVAGNTQGKKSTALNKERTREYIESKNGYIGENNPNWGKKYSKEEIQKIQNTKIARGISNGELIYCFDINKKFIYKDIIINNISIFTGVDNADIRRCLHKKCKQAKGYIFLKRNELSTLDNLISNIPNKHKIRIGKDSPYPIIECDLLTGIFKEYKSLTEYVKEYDSAMVTVSRDLRLNLFRGTKFIDFND